MSYPGLNVKTVECDLLVNFEVTALVVSEILKKQFVTVAAQELADINDSIKRKRKKCRQIKRVGKILIYS